LSCLLEKQKNNKFVFLSLLVIVLSSEEARIINLYSISLFVIVLSSEEAKINKFVMG
jgi:hypothetical protein